MPRTAARVGTAAVVEIPGPVAFHFVRIGDGPGEVLEPPTDAGNVGLKNRAYVQFLSPLFHSKRSSPCKSVRRGLAAVNNRWQRLARLLKKVFEIDPRVCTSGARMQIVSFINDVRVVDRILRHRESERCQARDPFEPPAPLRPPGPSLQQFQRRRMTSGAGQAANCRAKVGFWRRSARKFAACPEFALDFRPLPSPFPLCPRMETLIRFVWP